MANTLNVTKPKQNIPESKKNDEWYRQNVYYGLSQYSSPSAIAQRDLMNRNWRVYQGDIGSDEFNYLLYPEGNQDPTLTVQAIFRNYQLAFPLIQQRIGEYVSQKINVSVEIINREAVLAKQERKAAIMAEKIAKKAIADIEQQLGISIPVEDRSLGLPDDLKKLEKMKIREGAEDFMLNGINYLMTNYDFKEFVKKGLESYLITGGFIGINRRINNDPVSERVMPQDAFVMMKSDDDNVQWGDGWLTMRWLSIPSILDSYQLTDKQVDELEKLQSMTSSEFNTLYVQNSNWYDGFGIDYFYRNIGQEDAKVLVVEMEWRSTSHMYIKKSENKFDENSYFYKKLTEEEYVELSKKKKGDLERVPFHDLRHATMVGHEMLLEKGRVKDQFRSERYGYGRVPLQLFGVQKNPMLALMTILAPLQIEYSIGWFHIERLLAQAGGKAIELWMHNKPSGWSNEKWLFHARHKGLIVREWTEDKGMLSDERGMQQAIDLGLSSSLQYLIQYVGLIEQTAYRLVGTNPAAQGFLRGDELVGNVQANLVQSATSAAPIYYDIKRAVEQALNDAANKMKTWWKEGDVKVWLGDKEIIPMKVTSDMANYEYGIFVKNDASDEKAIQRLEQLSQLALQSGGAEFIDVLMEMEEGQNASEKRAIVKKGMSEIRKQQQQMQQQQMQVQQQMAAAKEQETALKAQEVQAKAETPIAVAQINKEAKENVKRMEIEHDENVEEIRGAQEQERIILDNQTKKSS
jgi:hypothetical protein